MSKLPDAVGTQYLKEAVQHLALSASEQLALLPDFVCKADELALEFDRWFDWAENRSESLFSASQWESLEAIETLLSQMSGKANQDLWTEEAVHHHLVWEQVRGLAQSVLDSCGWSRDGLVSLSSKYFLSYSE